MKQQTGIGLYLSNTSNKNYILEQIMANKFLLDNIDLNPLKGVLFSTITINRFIEEELRHDRYLIQTNENSSLGLYNVLNNHNINVQYQSNFQNYD